jgi:hypothetical protein
MQNFSHRDRTPTVARQSAWATLATRYRHPGRHLRPELRRIVVGLFGQIGEHHAEVWNERLRRRVTLACDLNAERAQTVAARLGRDWTPHDGTERHGASFWLDHRDDGRGGGFQNVHPYWKVERDPVIRREAFEDRWEAIEYIVVSPQLREDVQTANFALIPPALEHAETEAQFDTGGWPLELRRVRP